MTFAVAANTALAISNAIAQGYSYYQIINQMIKNDKILGPKIKEALKQGYSEDQIGEYLTKGKNMPYGAKQSILSGMTEKEKQDRMFYRQPPGETAAMKAIPLAAAGLGLAAGGKAALNAYQNRAIRPTAILPAQPAPQTPRQLTGQTPRGLPHLGAKAPGPTPPPISPRGTPQAPVARTTGQPVQTPPVIPMGGPAEQAAPKMSGGQILQNIGVMATLSNLVRNNPNLSPQDLAGVLKTVEPAKIQTLLKDKSVNLPQIVEEAVQELQAQPPQQPEQQTANVPAEPEQQQEQPIAQEPERQVAQRLEMPIQTTERSKPTLPISAKEKIESATFAPAFIKKMSDHDISKYHFSIPTYKMPSESPNDFKNRLIVNSAIEKAAKALEEGKSFLDFPEPFGRTETTEKTISRGPRKGVVEHETKLVGKFAPSVAADVLRFMAGVPNVFDPLLDDDERAEMNQALSEQGIDYAQAAIPSGDRNVYGAQMTPNLVWNLLLSVEPKLQEFEKPKSVKGYPKIPEGKMGTSELRRYLTHAVYGALSGQTITTKLADKIQKISNAAMSIDTMAEAAKQGNMKAMIEEQERLSQDDEFFYSLFTQEIEDMAKRFR